MLSAQFVPRKRSGAAQRQPPPAASLNGTRRDGCPRVPCQGSALNLAGTTASQGFLNLVNELIFRYKYSVQAKRTRLTVQATREALLRLPSHRSPQHLQDPDHFSAKHASSDDA